MKRSKTEVDIINDTDILLMLLLLIIVIIMMIILLLTTTATTGEFHCDGRTVQRGKHHILGDSLV